MAAEAVAANAIEAEAEAEAATAAAVATLAAFRCPFVFRLSKCRLVYL